MLMMQFLVLQKEISELCMDLFCYAYYIEKLRDLMLHIRDTCGWIFVFGVLRAIHLFKTLHLLFNTFHPFHQIFHLNGYLVISVRVVCKYGLAVVLLTKTIIQAIRRILMLIAFNPGQLVIGHKRHSVHAREIINQVTHFDSNSVWIWALVMGFVYTLLLFVSHSLF